jgi:ankyrin repeat protein
MSLKFETFCDHVAHGRLADVQRMLESESGELRVNGNPNDALLSAVREGHVDIVDYFLRHAMFDPSADDTFAIRLAAANGHLAVVERLLQAGLGRLAALCSFGISAQPGESPAQTAGWVSPARLAHIFLWESEPNPSLHSESKRTIISAASCLRSGFAVAK